MKQSDWNDRDIEKLVKKLPKINDGRKPESIYASIREQGEKQRHRKGKRIIPGLVAVAAIMIFTLLSPALLQQSPVEESRSEQGASMMDESKDLKADKAVSEKKERFSLYENMVEDAEVYTFGLISPEGVPVPVSVTKDLSDGEEWIDGYAQLAKLIPEEELGMEEFVPLEGTASKGYGDDINFTLKEDQPYTGNSAMEYAFYYSLFYSFQGMGFDQVRLEDENGNAPQFSGYGVLKKIELPKNAKQAFFTYSPNGLDHFLVPDNLEYEDLDSAVTSMNESESEFYESTIPEGLNVRVVEKGAYPIISFMNEVHLENMEESEALELIESLLLTARSFGYKQVMFENISEEEWGGFSFNAPIETPIAPNRITLKE
ncbi:hypothetical protein [Rossellomorea marisflavi]|uniref:hypothetical protein n=1 Tax=Rossellomorea marisflavi TaxID=189381 RepID=UPI0011E6B41C|nr:hypothetical protein [Rossellomorea marisflavi]TYO72967.1 hypothetical protein DQ398_001875 [Rossellomorea marisflavi]